MNNFYIILNRLVGFFLFVIFLPIIVFVSFAIYFSSSGNIIFKQERLGYQKRPFILYKFRSMIDGAESLKNKYLHLNEVDGPVFKIKDDPRYTKIGKFLSKSHVDELPQLINVINGEMLLVGFRPPLKSEVKKYSKRQMKRFLDYPGITSEWAVNGGHKKYTFNQWIESDINYMGKRNFISDLKILFKTGTNFLSSIFKIFNSK